MATPNIVPRADSEGGLGTASKYWASAYIDAVYVGAGKVGRDANNNIDFSVEHTTNFVINGNSELKLDASQLYPSTNDGLVLGTGNKGFSDLFLASGAVINFGAGNVTLTHSSNVLTLADGDYMQFGSSGDLQIYHSGASSAVNNTTGHLYISNGADDSDIIFQCDDGSGGTETYFFLDGSAGRTTFPDNKILGIGTGTDMYFIHDGTNSSIINQNGDLTIQNSSDDGDIIFSSDDGSGGTTAYLTLDGGATRTKFAKPTHHANDVYAYFGGGDDLRIFHSGTGVISNHTGELRIQSWADDLQIINYADDKDIIFGSDDGAGGLATYFYLDGSSATHDGSATTALYTNWPDNSRISVGTSHDLQLVHTGVNSVIQSLVGKFQIMSLSDDLEFTQFGNDKDINFSSDDGSGGTATYFRLDGGEGHMIAYKELNFADGVPVTFGNSAGGDLEIKEQSGSSYIMNHTGNLEIQNHHDDGDIIFSSDDGSGGVTTYFVLDGSSLTTKFQKDLRIVDNIALTIGNENDLILRHNATNSEIINNTGNLEIRNQQDDGDIIFKSDDGSGGTTAYLTLDGSSTITQVHKNLRFDDNVELQLGVGSDLRLTHNGTNSYIQNYGGNLLIKNQTDDGDIVFYCDNGAGSEAVYFTLDSSSATHDGSATTALYTNWPDKSRISLGSSHDLQIFHNATNSFIENAVGNLTIVNYADDADIILSTDNGSGTPTAYITLDGSAGHTVVHKEMQLEDNVILRFGTSNDTQISHSGSAFYFANGIGDVDFYNHQDGGDISFFTDDGSGGTTEYLRLDGGDVSTIVNTIKVMMPNLPTSDPSTAGQLWNDSGTLKISAG